MNKNYIYLVEGKCEEVFIKNIKDKYIKSGVIKIVNVAKERIKNELLRKMTINSYVILVFDTDVINFEILLDNKKRLERDYKVIFLYQHENFEDELIKSTNLKKIEDMFKVIGKDNHKYNFINCKDLNKKLEDIEFNFDKMWVNNFYDKRLPKSEKNKILK